MGKRGRLDPFSIRMLEDLEIEYEEGSQIPKPDWEDFAPQTYIRSGKEISPFIPYTFQLQLRNLLEKHHRCIVPKTRQLGLTEFIANFFLWKAYQDPSFLAVFFSKTQTDSSDIALRVKLMVSSYSGIETEYSSTTNIQLKNGGRLIFKPATPNAARSIPSAHALIYDECAFVPKIEEIYAASQPATALVEDSYTVMISTPNGCSGFFWDYCSSGNGDRNFLKECEKAREKGVNWWVDGDGWLKFLLHYKAHPTYSQDENYLETVKNKYKLPESRVQQEFNLNFQIDTRTLISRDWLEYYNPKPSDTYERIIQSWDTAATDKKSSAYWACSTWGISNGDYYLLDCYWEKHQYTSGIKAVKAQQRKWRPHLVLIEDKSTGIILNQDLPKDSDFTSPLKPISPKGSKEERLEAESPAIEAGRVILPLNAPWLYEVEQMLIEFPETEVKDVVDSISQFLNWARTRDYTPESHWKSQGLFAKV